MHWPFPLAAVAAASYAAASSLTPPVLPLIVRNPYLSTWLGNARELPWEHWPMFWTGNTVGCACARVCGFSLTGAGWPLYSRSCTGDWSGISAAGSSTG